jgi:hypothetical protein
MEAHDDGWMLMECGRICDGKEKVLGENEKSWGFGSDCWKSIVCVFLTKKSHKIHSMEESI